MTIVKYQLTFSFLIELWAHIHNINLSQLQSLLNFPPHFPLQIYFHVTWNDNHTILIIIWLLGLTSLFFFLSIIITNPVILIGLIQMIYYYCCYCCWVEIQKRLHDNYWISWLIETGFYFSSPFFTFVS